MKYSSKQFFVKQRHKAVIIKNFNWLDICPLNWNKPVSCITGTDLELPVKARVWDYTGRYLLGDRNSKQDVIELNNVEEHSKLSAGRFATYNLEWEWPYEWGDDEYDTLLGNMTVDNDLRLTVKINTMATADDSVTIPDQDINTPTFPSEKRSDDETKKEYGLEGNVSAPKTGVELGMLSTVALTLAFAVMLFVRPKRRENEDNGIDE